MNELVWNGDETIEDIYDLWIDLIERGNKAGLVKEIYCVLHGGESAYHYGEDGELLYDGPEFDSEEMAMLFLSYGYDADKVVEMVEESDEHEVGENLK